MQKYLLFNFPALLSACHYKNTYIPKTPLKNAKDTTIYLNDSIGFLRIAFPDRYDTFFRWTQYSDCSRCGTERYRFQPKSLPVLEESGFLWFDRKDSVDQLTIIHPQYLFHSDTLKAQSIRYEYEYMIEKAKHDPEMKGGKLAFDTLLLKDRNPSFIISSEKFDTVSKQYCKVLQTFLIIKGNTVQMEFKLITNKNDSITQHFVQNSRLLALKIHAVNN